MHQHLRAGRPGVGGDVVRRVVAGDEVDDEVVRRRRGASDRCADAARGAGDQHDRAAISLVGHIAS